MELELLNGRTPSGADSIYWEMARTGSDDERPVVVLSHGAGGSHAVWYQQVPVLAQSFRVLTWDARGFGNSTNQGSGPSAEAGGADLGAVLDAVSVTKAHLVGQSMGGWHISAFAVANPGRVQSLVYADTVGALWTPELRQAITEFMSRGGLTSNTGSIPIGRHNALWQGTAEQDLAHAFLYQQLGSFHQPPMDKLGDIVSHTVHHDDIAALGVPVLFVAGTHDEIFPASLLQASSEKIPLARFVEIPGSGHSPYFEQPRAWNESVLRFLNDAR